MSAPAVQAEPPRGPFGAVAVAGLLIVGIGAFCALVVLAAYAPDLEGDRAGGGSALSRSAVGFAGAVELLKAVGVPVTVSRDAPLPRARRQRQSGLLVLTPPPGRDGEAVRAAAGFAPATLVVLPKWDTARDLDHPGWVTRTGTLPLDRVGRLLPAPASLDRRSGEARPSLAVPDDVDFDDPPGSTGPVQELQTLAPSDTWQAVLADDTGRAVLARWTDHDLYVLTDPDLLDTQGLKDLATARAASAIVDELRDGGPVTFDVTLNGFSKVRSLLRLLFEPPLLGGTLCAAGAALMILLMAVRRFGPPTPEQRGVALGKRALADNAARLIARARREPAMAVPYAQGLRDAVARRGGTRAVPDAVLDTQARALNLPDTYSGLLCEAADTRDRAALMRVASRLHRWAGEMNRGHR